MNKRASEVLIHHSGRDELSLSALLSEVKNRSERGRADARERYERAVKYYNNIQGPDAQIANNSDTVDPPTRNYLRNLARTLASRWNENRQFPKVWPAKQDPVAVMAAEAANSLLAYQRHLVGFDLWSWDVAIRAQHAGSVGIIPYWDETRGDPIYGPAVTKLDDGVEIPLLDEDGDQVEELLGYEGEVVWRMFNPHEYSYWPVPRDRDLSSCRTLYIESDVDEHEARALLNDDDYVGEMTPDEHGRCTVKEIWYVPCRRIPNGLHALVVGDAVASISDWDLPFNRIPLAEFGLDPIDGTQYFTSTFHDSIDLQRMINDKEAAKFATVRRTGFPVGVGVGNLADEVYNAGRGGPGRVNVKDINHVNQGFRWVAPPDPHPLVFDTQGEDVRAMFDTMGVSEVSSGQESAKAGVSARGIAYMDHLDAQKISGDIRSLERFTRDLFWLTLEYYRAFSGEERRVKVFGQDGAVKEFAFHRADLDGYDLVYEPTDGKLAMKASVAGDAELKMQNGAGPVPELLEQASTGLGQSSGTVAQRVKIAQQAVQAMQGQAVQPDTSIPPAVAVTTLRVFQGERGVDTLIAAYEQLAQQQAAAGQSGGATPGPKPGAPQNK